MARDTGSRPQLSFDVQQHPDVGFAPIKLDGDVIGLSRVHKAKPC